MIRILIAGLLAAVVALAPNLSAQTVRSEPDCIRGTAEGLWNLPVARDTGHVIGKLVSVGDRTFLMEAKLGPPVRVGDRWVGRMEGVLVPADGGSVSDRPIALVRGRYGVGPLGNGRFEAGFLPVDSAPGAPPERIGRIWGLFRDDVTNRDADPGRFVARWVLCRPVR